MTCNNVYEHSCFILKRRQYRETSLIIDVFTQDFGRVALLAKGVRQAKSKTTALLQPFIPLALSYVGKSELKILTRVDVVEEALELNGLALYCGFYISELVMCFLHQHDPHPELFNDYHMCLAQLATATGRKTEAALRMFELKLLEKVGYGMPLETDYLTGQAVEASKKYGFDVENGVYEDALGYLSGSSLLALSAGQLQDERTLNETKRLMRKIIDTHLQGRPLKSRQVINQIMKRTGNES